MAGIALADRAVKEGFSRFRIAAEHIEPYISSTFGRRYNFAVQERGDIRNHVRRQIELGHLLFRPAVFQKFANLATAHVVKNHGRAKQIYFRDTWSIAATAVGPVAGCALGSERFLASGLPAPRRTGVPEVGLGTAVPAAAPLPPRPPRPCAESGEDGDITNTPVRNAIRHELVNRGTVIWPLSNGGLRNGFKVIRNQDACQGL